MLQLSEIYIYPIKSLGGIQLQTANLTDRGLQYDRRWLLTDSNGKFLTQREHPKLALFQPKIADDKIEITNRENGELVQIELNPEFSAENKKMQVTVWNDTMEAFTVDQEVSNWFSRFLNFTVHLVYMPDNSHRKVDPRYAITRTEINSFSDAYPYLIIGQSSLYDLNSRLVKKLPMNRFRPNFVFTNGEAFEEDHWKDFKIGEISLVGVKPCDRCIVTMIDQEKGIVSGKEPLKTLASYRNFGNKVLFGQNVIAKTLGTVSVGDQIQVKSLIS